MENPKAYIKEAWLKKHGKAPSPKIVQEILALAEKTHALEKSTDLETFVTWWNRLYMNESKIVKGKFVYYHDKEVTHPSLGRERDFEIHASRTTAKKEVKTHSKNKHHQSWWKLLLAWMGIATAGLVLVAFLIGATIKVAGLLTPDRGLIDDRDLQFAAIIVPDAQNAYSDLVKASEAMYYPEYTGPGALEKDNTFINMTNGTAWDNAVALGVVATNTDVFTHFHSAAKKSVYLNPLTAINSKDVTPFVSVGATRSFPKVAQLVSIHAGSLVRAGKDNKAMDEAFEIVRIGYLMEHAAQGFLIEYLTAMKVKKIGLDTIKSIARTGRFTAKERKAYAASLAQYQNDGSEIAPFWKGDYAAVSSLLSMVGQGTLLDTKRITSNGTDIASLEDVVVEYFQKTPSFYFYENETRGLVASLVRQNIINADLSCDVPTTKPVSLLSQKERTDARMLLVRNAAGKTIVDTVASLGLLQERMCAERALLEEVRALIEVKK